MLLASGRRCLMPHTARKWEIEVVRERDEALRGMEFYLYACDCKSEAFCVVPFVGAENWRDLSPGELLRRLLEGWSKGGVQERVLVERPEVPAE